LRFDGDVGDRVAEFGTNVVLSDVEHSWRKDRSGIVDVHDVEAVLEGTDFQHAQQHRLGLAHFSPTLQKIDLSRDFNQTTRDFCRNRQRLEERRLLGAERGRLCRHDNVNRRDGTGAGSCGDLERLDQIARLFQVAIGQDEANVLLDQGDQTFQRWVRLNALLDCFLHHGVLAHQNIAMAAHADANGLKLSRGHVVSIANENTIILRQQTACFLQIVGFPCLSIPFYHVE